MSEEKLNPQCEVVKMYLEMQIQKDEVLRASYVPEKIKDCFNYIKQQARKQATGGCAMIEDSVVFNWARDYFTDVLPTEKAKAEAKTEEPIKTTTEAPKVEVKKDKPVSEKKEVVIVKNGVKYDKNGFGLLFDDLY